MKSKNLNKKFNKINLLMILGLLLALMGVLKSYQLFGYMEGKERTYFEYSEKKIEQAKKILLPEIENIQNITKGLSKELSEKRLYESQINELLSEKLKKSKMVGSIGVFYKPYDYSRYRQLFSIEVDKKIGRIKPKPREEPYDYLKKNKYNNNWFYKPLKKGASWSNPYWKKDPMRHVISYSVPFYKKDFRTGKKKVAGIIKSDVLIAKIDEVFTSINLGKSGYAFMTTQNGDFISHPDEDIVRKDTNLLDHAKDINNDDIALIAKRIEDKNEEQETLKTQSYLIFSDFIKGANWHVFTVFDKEDIGIDFNHIRKLKVKRVFYFILGIVFLLIYFAALEYKNNKALWTVSISVSFLLIIGIFSLWVIQARDLSYNTELNKITDNSELGAFKAQVLYENKKTKSKQPTYFIPTGIWIKSIEFARANDFVITGIIWQKYKNNLPANIDRGFVFPDSIKTERKVVYRESQPDGELIGWAFNASIREKIEHKKYPFEKTDIYIRMQSADYDNKVVFVPDFSSYTFTNPSLKPGVSNEIVISSYKAVSSFFAIKDYLRRTNFGFSNNKHLEKGHELFFVILAKRQFIDSFVIDILPIIIVASIIFIIISLLTIKEEKKGTFGMAPKDVMPNCIALFFALIVAHIKLRSMITVSDILYIEYYYFIMYLMILAACIIAFYIGSSRQKHPIIEYNDNLIFRITYWPAILILLFILTVIKFYN